MQDGHIISSAFRLASVSKLATGLFFDLTQFPPYRSLFNMAVWVFVPCFRPAQTLTKHRTTTRKRARVLLEACGLHLHSSRQRSYAMISTGGSSDLHRRAQRTPHRTQCLSCHMWSHRNDGINVLQEVREGVAILVAKQESFLDPSLKLGQEVRMGKDCGTKVATVAISVLHTTGGIFVPLMATMAGLIVSVELHSPD